LFAWNRTPSIGEKDDKATSLFYSTALRAKRTFPALTLGSTISMGDRTTAKEGAKINSEETKQADKGRLTEQTAEAIAPEDNAHAMPTMSALNAWMNDSHIIISKIDL
jgi:hypothetical protein